MDAALAHVEDEEAERAEENDSQLLPISKDPVLLAGGAVLVDHVLAGEDHPKDHQRRVEDALLHVVEQVHPGSVHSQGQVLHGKVEEGQGTAESQQGLFKQGWVSWELVNSSPEPNDLEEDDRKEDGLERQPDLGEAAVLVDRSQPDVNLEKFKIIFLMIFFFCPLANMGHLKKHILSQKSPK